MNNESFMLPLKLSDEFTKTYEELIIKITKDTIEKTQNGLGYKPYMNKKEAAQYIGISYNTLCKFIECGLPVIEIDGVKLISKKQIDEFLEKNKQ